MATIADELLNDFNASDGDEDDEDVKDEKFSFHDDAERLGQNGGLAGNGDAESYGAGSGALDGNLNPSEDEDENEDEDEEDTKARVEKMELHGVSDVRSVAGLMKQLEPMLENIEHYKKTNATQQQQSVGNIEDNAEYKLLTRSNTMSTSIDGEIMLVHKFIRDHYSARFPELEKLVENPLDYAKVVDAIGNDILEGGLSQGVKDKLRSIVPNATSMTVNLEATQTHGQKLSEAELATTKRACEMMLKLESAKRELSNYVQSRMSDFAPNLTALIGSQAAAQLINFTGGMNGLARTPDRNLPSLGNKSNRKALGFATNTGIRNQGFLYQTDVIEVVPTDLKVQAMRILSAKIILAARIDCAHESPTGDQGREFLEQVERRIDKLSEIPANKTGKALPAPDEKPSRKRGGRRARKAKEATAMTDLRKAQNRMVFGKEEAEVGYGQGDSTAGMGMIGMQDDGRVRALQIDQRTRAKLSKKNPGWGGTTTSTTGTATSITSFGHGTATSLKGAGLRTQGVGGSGLKTNSNHMGGTTSTIAFTPVQGLELVDPKVREEQDRKRKAEADRWFSSGSFTQVGGGTPQSGPLKSDGAGFKIPALPAKRAKTGG